MSQSDTTPATEPAEQARMIRADLLAAIVFILLGAAILYGSWTMPRLEVRRIHPATIPGLVPGMLSFALIVCGTFLGVRSLRRSAPGGWRLIAEAIVSDAARRAYAAAALMLVYALVLVGWLPFWLSTAIFVFAFIVCFELWLTPQRRPPLRSLAWALGLAIVTAVTVTLVFDRLFLVRLP